MQPLASICGQTMIHFFVTVSSQPMVGEDVGEAVGVVVGEDVGDAVGEDVGVAVGDDVGEAVGVCVGVVDGVAVLRHHFPSGPHWSVQLPFSRL